MTVQECAEKMEKDRYTIYRWIKKGFKPRGKDPVRLYATRKGINHDISENSLENFLYRIRQ